MFLSFMHFSGGPLLKIVMLLTGQSSVNIVNNINKLNYRGISLLSYIGKCFSSFI